MKPRAKICSNWHGLDFLIANTNTKNALFFQLLWCPCGVPITRNRSYRHSDYCSKSKNECPYGIDRIFHLDNMKGKLVCERQAVEPSLSNPKVCLSTA